MRMHRVGVISDISAGLRLEAAFSSSYRSQLFAASIEFVLVTEGGGADARDFFKSCLKSKPQVTYDHHGSRNSCHLGIHIALPQSCVFQILHVALSPKMLSDGSRPPRGDVVDFAEPNDPDNPRYWTFGKKVLTTFLYGLTTLSSTWASAAYSITPNLYCRF